jgi:hypothetical protein
MLILEKLIYSCFIAIVVLASASQGGTSSQSQRIESNQVYYTFTANSVQCRDGDYIITKSGAGGFKVYLVENLFFLSPLLASKGPGDLRVVEQIVVADSATPPSGMKYNYSRVSSRKNSEVVRKQLTLLSLTTSANSLMGAVDEGSGFHAQRIRADRSFPQVCDDGTSALKNQRRAHSVCG